MESNPLNVKIDANDKSAFSIPAGYFCQWNWEKDDTIDVDW